MGNSNPLNKFKALVITEKPSRLSPECIRSFLQHALKLSKCEPKNFLKSLLISGAFLKVSSSYPVYTFIVEPGRNAFFVSFGKGIDLYGFKGFWFFDQTSSLPARSYGRTVSLLKLLNPMNFYVKLDRVEMSDYLLKQCEILFNLICTGITGLSLSSPGHAPLLERLASRLTVLDCDFEVVKRADVVSSLDLTYYNTSSIFAKKKFKTLLRYKIQNIYVNNFRFDDERDDLGQEKLQINLTLQTLKIRQFAGSHESLRSLFDLLKRSCPKLSYLRVHLNFQNAQLCPKIGNMHMDEVLNNLPEIDKMLQELREYRDAMSLSGLTILAKTIFRVPKDHKFDEDWPEKLKHLEGFKDIIRSEKGSCDVEFKSDDGLFKVVHRVLLSDRVN